MPDTTGTTATGTAPINPGDDAPVGTAGTAENLCPRCGGSGKLEAAPCPICDGTGKVNEGVGGG